MKPALLLTIALSLLWTSCGPRKEPAKEKATVVAKHASVRMKNSATSRTLATLEPDTHVDIMEKQGNWYRIRTDDNSQGWMEETTLMTETMSTKLQAMVTTARTQEAQNTALLRDDANLRMDPGRNTVVMRRLAADTKLEILERKTLPRPGAPPPTVDVWIKVRLSPMEVGWLLGSVLDYESPSGIGGYMEGSTYSAIKPINTVQDSEVGQITWYVVGERRPGAPPEVAFDGIRVFTWNMSKHRYETAYRSKNLRGMYPLVAGREGNNPMFQFYEMSADGNNKKLRKFVMNGVIVKESKTATP
ncbi:MAG TPA: SH3 domain-containing protein [Terriglobia bacterium]|nr:SH3 domain-containing protein [Terriglobia bacterium]